MNFKLKSGGAVGSVVPSDKQKAYGNYEKGHAVIHGMRISIENAAGTDRHGKDETGKEWKQKLAHDYGYVRGMVGYDKDKLDVFLGPKAYEPDAQVHVIDQNKKDGSKFDEHKAMFGFDNEDDAIMAYHRNYEPGWTGFRAVTAMTPQQFRDWGYAGRSGKRKPASEYVAFKGDSDGSRDQDLRTGGRVVAPTGHGQHDGASGRDLRRAGTEAVRGVPGRRASGSRAVSRDLRPGTDALALRPGAHPLALRPGTNAHAGGSGAHAHADGHHGHDADGSGALPQSQRAGGTAAKAAGAGNAKARSIGDRLRIKQLRQQLAEGGSVDGSERGDADEGRAFVGYRSPKRSEAGNARRDQWQSGPASLLRGVLAGTAGLPGDLEGVGRSVASAVKDSTVAKTLGKAIPGLGLLTQALGSSPDNTPRLPTSEFYNEWLPGAGPKGGVTEGFTTAGNFAGLLPHEVAGLTSKVAKPAAKGVSAMLEAAAANAAKPGPFGMMNKQTGAIKLPGGNWAPGAIDRAVRDVIGFDRPAIEARRRQHPDGLSMVVEDWMSKRLGKWAQNEMGTAKDPLLKLETEGRLHRTPAQLEESLDNIEPDGEPGNYTLDYSGAADFNAKHTELTGRPGRTAWEMLTDMPIEQMSAQRAMRESLGRGDTPEWLIKQGNQDPSAPVYGFQPGGGGGGLRDLGFDHMRDYLRQATMAHQLRSSYGTPEKIRKELEMMGVPEDDARWDRLNNFVNQGLDIDPAKLNMMSLPDVAGMTSKWNDVLKGANRIKDINKGIKNVVKQYGDSGHQWVELDKDGLAGEGGAMGHCVGGYCDSVEGGNTRILSLRDKKGQPHVTVELTQPDFYARDTQNFLANEAKKRGYAGFEGSWTESPNYKQNQETLANLYEELGDKIPWNIAQIKGKGNRAPIAEYQPAVQDLVRNMGPWGDDIGDLQNTGLMRLRESDYDGFNNILRASGSKEIDPRAYRSQLFTPDELDLHLRELGLDDNYIGGFLKSRPKLGYAQGGTVANRQTVGLGQFGAMTQPDTSAQSSGGGWGFQGGLGGTSGGSTALSQVAPSQGSAQVQTYGGGQGNVGTWSVNNGQLVKQDGIKAPTYDDNTIDFMGQTYMNPLKPMDPALAMTLGAGDKGGGAQGIGAFLNVANNNAFNAMGKELEGGSRYNPDEMKALARQFGVDVSGAKSDYELQETLNSSLKDYMLINGLSAGWNPNGNGLGANATIYKRENGKLVPYQTAGYTAQEKGGWLSEHQGILAPLAVMTGGLAYGALAGGAAAGAGGAAAGAGGAGAGAGGAAAGAGAGAATGAGTAGISGSIANALGVGGWWGGLSPTVQGALTGATVGGTSSGLRGGNVLQGALMGGLTGGFSGAGGWAGAVGQAGSSYAPLINAAGNAGLGYLRGGTNGALGSLAGSAGGMGGTALGSQFGNGWAQAGGYLGGQTAGMLYNQSRKS